MKIIQINQKKVTNQKILKLPGLFKRQMTDSSPDPKNYSQNNQPHDQNARLKKGQTQQSLNTKNFIKKMTSKKGQQQDQKAQPKITSYMNFSNSTSLGNGQKDQNNISITSQDQRIRDLQQRMKQRDLQIEKMKRARQIDQNRYSNLFIENKEFKKKSRQAIAKSMLEAAQFRRAQRRQINPKLGYFKDGSKNFIEGSMLINLKQRIKQKKQMINQLDQQKKSKDLQKKERAIFKAEFLQKEIASLQKQLQSMENSIKIYQDQLKLADKQTNCEYALKGWPIVFDQYQPLQLLGKGGFGDVYKCYDLQSNQIVALKVNNFNKGLDENEELFKHVQREAETNKKLSHPNISKFIKLLQCNSNRIVFVLEFCSGPELSTYIKKHNGLEEKQAKQIIRQIFSALHYLSTLKEKIIHYDLKPANIMFHYGLVKILDFGLCKPMENEQSRMYLTSQGVGTYWYLPPETFDQNDPLITPKVDVWSAGIIFYEMLYAKKPFGHNISQDKIYNQQIILNAKKVEFPAQTPKKYKVSEAAKNFIRQCLSYKPQDRLNASEAYEHEYFKK